MGRHSIPQVAQLCYSIPSTPPVGDASGGFDVPVRALCLGRVLLRFNCPLVGLEEGEMPPFTKRFSSWPGHRAAQIGPRFEPWQFACFTCGHPRTRVPLKICESQKDHTLRGSLTEPCSPKGLRHGEGPLGGGSVNRPSYFGRGFVNSWAGSMSTLRAPRAPSLASG